MKINRHTLINYNITRVHKLMWCSIICVTSLCSCLRRPKPEVMNVFSRLEFLGASYDTFIVDTRVSVIRIYFKNPNGERFENVHKLSKYLYSKSETLVFATNGGMYHPNYEPVGLLVLEGEEYNELNLEDGPGNFFMKPNGVFVIKRDGEAALVQSLMFNDLKNEVFFATQSGPMLVFDDKINPKFNRKSKNKFIRSGVGIIDKNRVVFCISNEPVIFRNFSLLFREKFGCENALFLDGVISKFYVPDEMREDIDGNFGVLIAVLDKS